MVVDEEDTFGNIETGDSTTTLSLSANNGGGGFSCSTTPTKVTNGVATYAGCSYTTASTTAFTLTASSGSLTTATANTTVSASTSGDKLVFVAEPTSTFAGTAISPSVTVQMEDQFNNNVPESGINVTLSVSSGSISSGGSATTGSSGLATFGAITIGTAGANLTLGASSAGMTPGTSTPFTVSVLVSHGATFTDTAADAGSGVNSVSYSLLLGIQWWLFSGDLHRQVLKWECHQLVVHLE